MKINGQYPKPTAGDRNVQGATTNEAKKASSPVIQAPQQKSIHPELTLNKVRAKIEAEPDINQAKVDAIKAKIAKGEYKVDAKLLAANLIKGSLLEDQ
ncbi:MAG: flagellar biosynthesis anti-sigma factor FlgM [Candidatus Lambdaproteobacteria bacterium RIFOXYD12_FULL_49_8]|uniref:Negative regulator of flagellin synthesis n=1 Tax=Candidatus Lambdaproteobacteria bacterium RIFOXYD2_FULL_50_16 TaxID=1817772 RepID=A0A1F6GAZ0_9PROT|nr:MAG: flagellar biosynthesis anti-sigma factor FlgM [Candidatus Lambdaproteobacteria bacterium RIFOXYD2_FULL_50_16]OGG96938.1 MAG: flagellar biosynthesis anti-sigma factor FlgM [Candidatus Lambdaproteobacteria bacterium RIFOXYD12_FULL_49_8]